MTDLHQELSRTVIRLVMKRPFFGHLGGALSRVVTTQSTVPLSLVIVSGRYALAVSPTLFLKLTQLERLVALEHELVHIVLHHPRRAADYQENGVLFGMACDLVVNQLLSVGQPNPGMLTLASLHSLELPAGLSAPEYYQILRKHLIEGTLPACCCGGLGGANPWAWTRSQTQLADSHFDDVIYHASRRVGRRAIGSLASRIRQRIEAIIEEREGTLNWRRVLRGFSASSRRSKIHNTMRRPSKRYGTFPGTRLKRKHRVAVCVDTSGSISVSEFQLFFAEIRSIWRAGSDITVIECDAAVQDSWAYQGRLPDEVSGRGGTAFEPALAQVRSWTPRFDACMYLTDGAGPAPTTSPGCPLLWIVTPGGRHGDHLCFGRSVEMRA